MKLFSVIVLLIFISCSENKESERINKFSSNISTINKIELQNYIQQIKSYPYDKFGVKLKLHYLDSLTNSALSQLNNLTSKKAAKNIFKNWKSSVTKQTGEEMFTINIQDLLKDPFFISSIKYEIIYNTREHMKHLANYIGASDIKMDKIGLFVIPEKTTLKIGEKYNAKVLVGAYSKQAEQIFDIRVNGKSIHMDNGIGIIEFKSVRKGSQKFLVDVVGVNNNNFIKTMNLSQEILYLVE